MCQTMHYCKEGSLLQTHPNLKSKMLQRNVSVLMFFQLPRHLILATVPQGVVLWATDGVISVRLFILVAR